MANIDDKKIPVGGKETPIPNRLHDVSEDHVVTGANEVFDDSFGERQSRINDKLRHYTKMAHIRIDAEEITREHNDNLLNEEINAKQLEIGAVETDIEPILESPNILPSGAIAFNLGYYITNPEWALVIVDGANRVVAGIKKNAEVEWMAGVPKPVKEYIEERIVQLSDIISEALETKVDKEDGKSLIDEDFADGISFVDNLEFVSVITDSIGRVVAGIRKNADIYFAAGIPSQIRNYINDILKFYIQIEYIDNQEYADVITDSKGRIIEATKRNGVKVFPAGIEAPNVLNYSKTVYVKKDGSGDFTKIVDALAYSNEHKDVTIVVSSGTYDLIEELGTDYFDSIPNSYYQGLRIGNGTTIKANGNGVVIKAQYTGSNIYVGYQFSLLNISGSCTIEGISFIAQNTRYVIHDDPNDAIAESTDYVVTFRNCIFNHKGSTMYDVSQSRPISIGGGCHHGSMHIYDGCIFKTENDLMLADLSYHDASNCYSKVVVSNCYFDRDKTIAGRSDVSGIVNWFVSNNRFGSSPQIRNPEYVHVIEFGNIISQ